MPNCEETCEHRRACRKKNTRCCHSDADGLPMQCVGEWESAKHMPLAAYIEASSGARNKFGGGAYIDLFAGPGRARVRETGDVVNGSPLIALRHPTAPFTRVFLCEWDNDNVKALEARTAPWSDRTVVLAGDCHKSVDEIVKQLPGGLHLVLVDPYKMEQLVFETVAKLARVGKVDFLVNVPLMDLERSWHLPGDRLSRAAGGPVRGHNVENVRRNFFDVFRQSFAALGFQIDEDSPTVKSFNSKNRGLFNLMLATRHPLGRKIWKSVNRVTDTGQRVLDLTKRSEGAG